MAAAGFRTRKVKLEQSIGDKLKRARIRRKISVADVEEATRIRAKFILALESDSWDQIPSEVYGRGYLEAYAEYLKLPGDAMMKQYDRARAMYKRHETDPVELAPVVHKAEPKFLLTPRSFMIGGIALAALAFAVMVGYQINEFTEAPSLLVTTAEAKTINASDLTIFSNSFTVTGQTDQGATVSINGKAAQVEADGNFSLAVPVQPGVNPIVVTATNAKGNATKDEISVTVK